MPVFIRRAADEPFAALLGFAGNGDIVSRLGLEVAAVFPIDRHVLDELKGIRKALIVFRLVAGHLYRRIHSQVERKLAGQGSACPLIRLVTAFIVVHTGLENARSVIHRTSHQTGEWQNGGMVRRIAAHALEFRASG